MRSIKSADGVVFADDKKEEEFNSLPEDDWLKKALKRTISNLRENVLCGEKIRKRLIPRAYIQKYNINNLFWYSLPNAWRLVYSILMDDSLTIAIIIEYFNHKDYERKFRY